MEGADRGRVLAQIRFARQAQAQVLRRVAELGIDYTQGYAIGKPRRPLRALTQESEVA